MLLETKQMTLLNAIVHFASRAFAAPRGGRRFSAAIFALALLAAGGCAPKNYVAEEEGAFDPLEPINRGVYGFNKKADFFVLKPLAKGYRQFFPPLGKAAVGNVFSNLGEGRNIANHVLQKNGDDAARSAARLVFNTVFGLGGLLDVADDMGIPQNNTGFGDTVRAYNHLWSGRETAYLMLPLLGPSSLSDVAGQGGDNLTSPLRHVDSNDVKFGATGLLAVDRRAQFLDKDALLESALDEYSLVRDIYQDGRRRESSGRNLWGQPDDVWNR